MHQDKCVELARQAAVSCGERHDYMPPTDLLSEVWHPDRWVIDAMLLAAHEAERERDSYRAGNTQLLDLLMQFCDGVPGVRSDAMTTLRSAGMLNEDDSMNWMALKAREPKPKTWADAVNESVTDPAARARLLAIDDDEDAPT